MQSVYCMASAIWGSCSVFGARRQSARFWCFADARSSMDESTCRNFGQELSGPPGLQITSCDCTGLRLFFSRCGIHTTGVCTYLPTSLPCACLVAASTWISQLLSRFVCCPASSLLPPTLVEAKPTIDSGNDFVEWDGRSASTARDD